MTLNDIIAPLIKWWWLLLVSSLIAAVSSFVASSQQPPVYQSSATLMIGSAIQDPNPSSGELYLEQQLASTYASIANREPIRTATMQALGVSWLPEYHVTALPNSQLIQIVVIDTIPERAQVVAQELANQLILQSPSGLNQEDQERRDFVENQLNNLQEQIIETQSEIETLQNQLGELNSARQIADTQEQIRALDSVLSSLQSNYANLLSNTAQGATNTLAIIEYPGVPHNPVGPNTLMTVFLSAAVGFSLAAAGAYLLEYLDKSVKTEDEVKKLIPAPILGHIPIIPKEENKWLFVTENPRSPISDSFRNLRTNIELAGPEIKTILVTSSTIAVGKTTTAINYAQILTQANKKVILVDGDLRKSILNDVLEFPKHLGLSKILQGKYNLKEISFPLKKGLGLVIPSGPPPVNPTELLASEMMIQTLSSLKKMAEVVIIDGPPIFVADAIVLANQADGILLVIQLGKTRRDAIKEMVEQIERINIKIIGVVINKVSKRSNYYANYYGNYYDTPKNDEKIIEEDREIIEAPNENPEDDNENIDEVTSN